MAVRPLHNPDIAIVALHGTVASSVSPLLDAMALAAQQVQKNLHTPMELRTRLLTAQGEDVVLSNGQRLRVDGDITEMLPLRLIYLPTFVFSDTAALNALLSTQPKLYEWLRAQRAQHTVIAASGSATFLLAEAGLLRRGVAAVPPRVSALFRSRYPDVRADSRTAIVEHGGIFTNGSLVTEWQFVMRLIDRTVSPNLASWLASVSGLRQAQIDQSHVSEDALVASAQFWLAERYGEKLHIRDLAEHLAVSHQTLIRRFERSLGMTPSSYVQKLRIDASKHMLRYTARPVSQIAAAVGYMDSRSFRQLFEQNTGLSPSEFRRAQQAMPSPARPSPLERRTS